MSKLRRLGEVAAQSASELLQGALDLLLPPSCGACGTSTPAGEPLCARCDLRLERIAADACTLCQAAPRSDGAERCAGCDRRGRGDPSARPADSPLAACLAAVRFEGDAADWMHRFKYPRPGLRALDPVPAAVVGAMLREAAARVPASTPDWIAPVPLHPRRLRERGFNPACVLARRLAREHGVRCHPAALRRIRDTPSQTGLDRSRRRENVRGAFEARVRVPARIWLVDDVVTTGSTLAEAALALRAAGAHSVIGLCAARSLLDVPAPHR
ncbi:MAG TPA: double zinc ribbon domain-containing protein [Myxococcota bacterium]|nr:double zinc ribbon domain-containing protein [Myxococcota bacterium]